MISITYNVLKPDLVESIKYQSLHIRGGHLRLDGSSRSMNLGKSRLRNSGNLSHGRNDHSQDNRHGSLHFDELYRQSQDHDGKMNIEEREKGKRRDRKRNAVETFKVQ